MVMMIHTTQRAIVFEIERDSHDGTLAGKQDKIFNIIHSLFGGGSVVDLFISHRTANGLAAISGQHTNKLCIPQYQHQLYNRVVVVVLCCESSHHLLNAIR